MSLSLSAQKQKTWLVLPAYNEERYLLRVLQKISHLSSQVIVVDDGSVDNTADEARKLATYTLRHEVNLGKGAALKTGCDFAFNELKAEAVILLDADDQHDPAELPEFWAALSQGVPVVLGVREVNRQMPMLRSLTNNFASYLIKLFFGRYIPDIPSGYKAFTKEAYQKIRWTATDYAVEMEIAARMAKHNLAYKVVCIKTIYHDMNKGMTMLDVFQMVTQLLNWKVIL